MLGEALIDLLLRHHYHMGKSCQGFQDAINRRFNWLLALPDRKRRPDASRIQIKIKDVSPILYLYLVKAYFLVSRMGADLQRLIQYCAIKNTDGGLTGPRDLLGLWWNGWSWASIAPAPHKWKLRDGSCDEVHLKSFSWVILTVYRMMEIADNLGGHYASVNPRLFLQSR